MKNFTKGKFLQKIMSIILIFVMLSSYFPMFVLAEETDETTDENSNDYIVLNAGWQKKGDEISTFTDTACIFEYNLKLNGVSTGFKNVTMNITNKNDNTPIAKITSNINSMATSDNIVNASSYSNILFGNLNTGIDFEGAGNVVFENDGTKYNKDIVISVTATYIDPISNEEVTRTIEKTLKAIVTPNKEVTHFLSLIKMQHNNYGVSLNERLENKTVSLGMSEYGRSKGWYATETTATYPIRIESYTHTQKLELNITINRLVDKESKLGTGFTINWGGLDTILGNPTEITNSDGSITYKFTKGEDAEQLVKDNTFSIKEDFNVIIKYTIPNTNPDNGGELKEGNTTCLFTAEMQSKGFKIEKEYNKDEVITPVSTKTSINKKNSIALYQYTPGNHANISADISTKGNSYIELEEINKFIENKTMDLTFNTNIDNSRNWGDAEYQEGDIIFSAPEITYLSDNGEIVTKTLTAEQMRLKTVKGEATPRKSSLYYLTEATPIELSNTEYNLAENININEYKIRMYDYLQNNFGGNQITYTLNADKLGLTDNELENILTISVDMRSSGLWLSGHGTATYYNINSLGNKYSYFEFDIGENFGTDVTKIGDIEEKTITLKMFKNSDVIKTKELVVLNENPVFYVQLPSQFKYSKIKATITENSYISINENEIKYILVEGEKYLVIPCTGTYDSSKMGNININISFVRKLNNALCAGSSEINAYMLTDNERYFFETDNDLQLTKNDYTPEKVFKRKNSFKISGSNVIYTDTIVKLNSNNQYRPNPANDNVETGEKEEPIIVDSNKTITFGSTITASGESIKNLSIVSRLPIANNKYFDGEDILESPYTLPDDFYEKYKDSIKEITSDKKINECSLQDLSNIKVLLNDKTIVNPTNYTILYSTEENASFDSTSFVEYEEGVSDLSQAKNLMVRFNSDYTVSSGNTITVVYDMTMPDDAGMVGATTAVKYTKSDDETTTAYSPIAYVINGDTRGTINVTKKFEGYNEGVAPSGVSISGIEFKLQYYDENSGENKFLQDSQGNDITAKTNEQGVATFSKIPYGEYILYEVTTFDNYDGIGNLNLIDVQPAETVDYTAENKLKRGQIIINKQWEDTNEIPGTVEFLVQRTSTDSVNFIQKTVETNEEGKAILSNVPYGNYSITESKGLAGWKAEPMVQNITVSKDVNETSFTNVLGKGNLQIVKTVPDSETVDGLKFHITGLGMVSYINKEGKEVFNNTDLTITVGDDYSSNNDITVEKSENDTKATITISNVYLGLYTVQEVEIPKIDGTDIEKYVAASAQTNLTVCDKTEIVTIRNRYKTGTLKIQKTAKLKEGNTYTDIGDLSPFKVRVTGTSYYGNEVNTLISLTEDGYGEARLEIGKYTITEVAQDGYTAYYGKDATASTTPPEITINYNTTITQDIYNEHTGIGYVRVEKTLEGKTDPQKVIDAGIEFKVVGQNVAGGRVEEIIKIDKLDTDKNVAYGVSGPISSGGEYQLEEVESTVPDFFEGIEPIKIDLRTSHTAQAPLVIEAENKRTLGNLEIITQTNPTGGPLTGITYNVTEVEISNDGTYTKLGETTLLEGNNDTINTSFAEMKNIYAGFYLVEQVTVPEGWQKDVAQIVEVPSYNIGYATFEITEISKLSENKVTISKQILNSNNEVATSEDFANAQLNENESFEVKLTNVDTKEVYYTFISKDEPGVVVGLDAGTYEIEEAYKPKYTTEGYYTLSEGIDLDTQETKVFENIIYPIENKYLFTIEQNQTEVLDVNIMIKNKINKDFGFGGQVKKDNYSKVDVEQNIKLVTKTIIYVVDEEDNAISGVKFKLLNEEGKVVKLINSGTEFEVDGKRITLKGLPIGKYTLVNTEYPQGYLKPQDKEIIVYQDAVQVARVEIQKNIPRGSLTLSTVYTTDEGETKYIPRSKYKVVNKETGELVKFERTATGDYRKTNLEGASPIIVLKSGTVELEGIEVGTYEVGIVDVTKGYGIQSDLPEIVEVKENTNENVSVEVISKDIIQVEAGPYTSMYINESGELYAWGDNQYGALGNGLTNEGSTSVQTKVEFPQGVKIAKVSTTYNSNVLALDTEGRVWNWGYQPDGTTITTPTLVLNGMPCIDISVTRYCNIVVDYNGMVWTLGYNTGDGTTNSSSSFKCISTVEGSKLFESYKQGIKIEKIAEFGGKNSQVRGLIDSLGRVWTWGYLDRIPPVLGTGNTNPVYSPVCISETTDLKDVKIESLTMTESFSVALDENGNVWYWGAGPTVTSLPEGKNSINPYKIDSSAFGNSKIIKVTGVALDTNSGYIIALDEYGKVWSWGTNYAGTLGQGSDVSYVNVPTCISDDETETLYGIKIDDISTCVSYLVSDFTSGEYPYILAVDSNNRLWTWGGFSSRYSISGPVSTTGPIYTPRNISISYKAHLEYNLKFKEVYSEENQGWSFAIDEEGNLWSWGYSAYGDSYLGYSTYSDVLTPKKVDIPGNLKVKKVQSYNYSTMILCENGSLFVCGNNSGGVMGNGANSSRTEFPLTEITDKFNLDYDEKIVDIYMGTGVYMALDNNGKVYTWGSGAIGRDTSVNPYEVICISDDKDEVLYGKEIVQMSGRYESTYLLDKDGKVYNIGGYYNSTNKTIPICLTETDANLSSSYNSGVKIVDILEYNAIDSNGKLWNLYYGNKCECISDIVTNDLFKMYKQNENYKIVKMYDTGNYTGYILAKDINGDFWNIESLNAKKLQGTIRLDYVTTKTDLMPKNIISLNGHLLVDEYGQIWVYKNVDNWDGEAGIGTTDEITEPICLTNTNIINGTEFKANNTLVNVPIENKLNGIKIKELVNDNFAIDTNGNVWYFGDSISAINLSEQFRGDENLFYGNKVAKIINNNYVITTDNEIWYIGNNYPTYVMDTVSTDGEFIQSGFNSDGHEYYITLEPDGKIWACGSLNGMFGITNRIVKPICISTIEGSELKKAHDKYNDFKIVSVNNLNYAIDNKGKLWTWGRSYGDFENIVLPKCITDIENTELYKEYNESNNYTIEKIYNSNGNAIILIDSNGKLWSKGTSIYNGNGGKTTDSFECISNIISTPLYEAYQNNVKIIDYNSDLLAVIGDDGKVYSLYNQSDRQSVYDYYQCINSLTGIKGIINYRQYVAMYSNTGLVSKDYNKYLAYGDSGIYEIKWGKNYPIQITPITNVRIKKIIDLYSDINARIVLDENGKIWWLGENHAYIGISNTLTYVNTCLSDDSSFALYGKEIVNIEYINKTILAEDSEGNLYAWGYFADNTPSLFTHSDDIVRSVLKEEPNNENRIKVLKMLSIPSYSQNSLISVVYQNGEELYNYTINTTERKVESIKSFNLTKQYLGEGTIEEILDNSHVKLTDGTILQIRENGEVSYVTEYTPNTEQPEEIQPVQIEGVNIVKQTKYKALDDNGNLYVWDKYTGFISAKEGIINTTTTEYDVEPIYSCTNGWSIITNQF